MQAGGVDEHQLGLPLGQDAGDAGPGGLRFVRNNGDLLPYQAVEQGRFAHIGLADNGHKGRFGHRLLPFLPTGPRVSGAHRQGLLLLSIKEHE